MSRTRKPLPQNIDALCDDLFHGKDAETLQEQHERRCPAIREPVVYDSGPWEPAPKVERAFVSIAWFVVLGILASSLGWIGEVVQ